jgi:hypothetical protein
MKQRIKQLAGIALALLAGLLVMHVCLKHRPGMGSEWNSCHDVSGIDTTGWMPRGG